MTAPVTGPRTGVAGSQAGGAALVVTLGALSAFGPLCLDMYLPALPQLAGALGSTDAAAQLSLSACILGLALGQLVVGPMSDRWGRRGPLLIGVGAFAVISAVCAITTSMPLLIAGRLLQGAAGAAGIVVGRAVVADMFAGRAAAAYFATMAAINGLAPILAPVIGGQILRVGTWRTVFWVLAAIGVALWLATLVVVRETLPPDRRGGNGFRGTLGDFRVVLTDRFYVGYVLAGAMVAAAMFGYISGSSFLLQDGFGLTPQQFSLCFAANALGIVAATQLGRVLLRRTDSTVILRCGVVQAAIGAVLALAAVLLHWGLWQVLIGLFVMVSAVGLALPHASALAMDRHRRIAGAASAVFGLTQYALGAITAPLVGIGDRSTGVALGVTAVSAVAIGAAALLLTRSGPRRSGSGDRGSSGQDSSSGRSR